MARTKKVRFNEEPNLSKAIYHFNPSLTYISLHSKHAVKMEQIRKREHRRNIEPFDIDADINAAYKQVSKRSPEKKLAHTQVYNRSQEKKTAHTQVYYRPQEKKASYNAQDSYHPTYYGLLPSEIHPISVTPTLDHRRKIQSNPAQMPQKTAPPAPDRHKIAQPVPAQMPQKPASPAQDRHKIVQSVPTLMPQKTTAQVSESRRERPLSTSTSRRSTSSAPYDKTTTLIKDFAGRFDGISFNMNTIALVTSILAVILFLFIGYVTISIFRDRNYSGGESRIPVESSVTSHEDELPEYCPRLTLITHSVTLKAGEHFSPLDYIGTISDDTDTQETLSHNIMLIGYDKLDESKKGTYQVGYYLLDSDNNQSNIEYLDITVH